MKKIALVLLLVGCTDAQISQVTTLGDTGSIVCYSGGTVIFDGKSTGKISTEERSDGWYFRDASTGRLIRVSGDCVIRN